MDSRDGPRNISAVRELRPGSTTSGWASAGTGLVALWRCCSAAIYAQRLALRGRSSAAWPPGADATAKLLDAGGEESMARRLRRASPVSSPRRPRSRCCSRTGHRVSEIPRGQAASWALLTSDPGGVAPARRWSVVRFCLDRLEWGESTPLPSCCRMLCIWDEQLPEGERVAAARWAPRPRRNPGLSESVPVPCYEVELHKLEFDIWTESEFYTLCVPRHPFGQLYRDMLAGFEQLRLQEKEDKLKAKAGAAEAEKEEKEASREPEAGTEAGRSCCED
uniref:Uncharacterized protein n=1 Tax=Macrostomum lignano TaxID=282301 RepID=A0A1I8FPJ0_9PLAT